VAVLDRILADDFALVIGSGKIYTKADLLAEARSGRVHYERQDDADQTVRIWGDTAVIAVLLTEKSGSSRPSYRKQVLAIHGGNNTPLAPLKLRSKRKPMGATAIVL
jgi:hypothetical protein